MKGMWPRISATHSRAIPGMQHFSPVSALVCVLPDKELDEGILHWLVLP